MKFSFRIFLAISILLGLWALVIQQVLLGLKNNPNSTPLDTFFSIINPFWKAKNPDNFNTFPVRIPIPVVNPTDGELLVSGKIFLSDSEWKNLTKIGLINTSETSSGTLTDYLNINPEKHTLQPHSEYSFDVFWHGFGDQYIPHYYTSSTDTPDSISENTSENSAEFISTPIVTFQTLSDIFQTNSSESIQFFEKIILKHHTYELTARTELTSHNINTDIETIESPQEWQMSVPYVTIEKTINTGLIIHFGILISLLLALWAIKSPQEIKAKFPRISKEELKKIEAEFQKIQEKRKQKNTQKNHKK